MTPLLAFLAQTSDGLPLTWPNLVLSVVGSIPIATVLGWRLHVRDQEIRDQGDELRDTNAKLLDLAERALPVLGEATRTLSDVARRHDDSEGTDALRGALRRLELQIADLGRGPGRD